MCTICSTGVMGVPAEFAADRENRRENERRGEHPVGVRLVGVLEGVEDASNGGGGIAS